jgi:polysaccharide export outer membrane protein
MNNICKKNLPFNPSALYTMLLFFAVATGFISCTSAEKIKYFNNLSDSQLVRLPAFNKPEAIIMPDDILEIKIIGANEATVSMINGYPGPASSASNTYTVDAKGEIEFALIGKVKAGGLTREQLKNDIQQKASKYLKDALVTVKQTTFKFTVLGEVNAPGTYTVNNEKVTILEALGLARDMTQFARRNNVRVIRDSSGNRQIGMINFNDKTVFTSQYYYLQRNDVVYVEPDKNKGKFDQYNRVGSILATVLSVIAVGITIFR